MLFLKFPDSIYFRMTIYIYISLSLFDIVDYQKILRGQCEARRLGHLGKYENYEEISSVFNGILMDNGSNING